MTRLICLQTPAGLGVTEGNLNNLARLRAQFEGWDRERQNTWLFQTIKLLPYKGTGKLEWTLFGTQMSLELWAKVLNCSQTRVKRIAARVCAGNDAPPCDGRTSGLSLRVYETEAAQQATAFLSWFYTMVAEPLAEGPLGSQTQGCACTPWLDSKGTQCLEAVLRDPAGAILDPQALQPRLLASMLRVEMHECMMFWDFLGDTKDLCSYSTFCRVFQKQWKGVLRLSEGQHKRCANCVKCVWGENRQT